jgi:hypothetical protein
MPYEIDEHRHRFAVWAAARAAQRGFADVATLRKALEVCGIVEYLKSANFNDIDQPRFDAIHRLWCRSIVDFLGKGGVADATFGRAAKLIAVYLKSAVVLGANSGTAFARIAHPPIDSILLGNLAASDGASPDKASWAATRWTKLNEARYYELIGQLRSFLGSSEPFWKLEQFWTVTNDDG